MLNNKKLRLSSLKKGEKFNLLNIYLRRFPWNFSFLFYIKNFQQNSGHEKSDL